MWSTHIGAVQRGQLVVLVRQLVQVRVMAGPLDGNAINVVTRRQARQQNRYARRPVPPLLRTVC
jgi:hypothetical protein